MRVSLEVSMNQKHIAIILQDGDYHKEIRLDDNKNQILFPMFMAKILQAVDDIKNVTPALKDLRKGRV